MTSRSLIFIKFLESYTERAYCEQCALCWLSPPRSVGLYKLLQKNKDLVAKAMDPAKLSGCRERFSEVLETLKTSTTLQCCEQGVNEKQQRVNKENSVDVENVDSSVSDNDTMDTELTNQKADTDHVTSTSDNETDHVTNTSNGMPSHVTELTNEIPDEGVYDPSFPGVVFDASVRLLASVEDMHNRLSTASLHTAVSGVGRGLHTVTAGWGGGLHTVTVVWGGVFTFG